MLYIYKVLNLFTDENTETRKVWVTGPRSHNQEVPEPGFVSWESPSRRWPLSYPRHSTNVHRGLYFIFSQLLGAGNLKNGNLLIWLDLPIFLNYMWRFCLFFRLISYLSNHSQSLSGFGKVGLIAWQNKGKRNCSFHCHQCDIEGGKEMQRFQVRNFAEMGTQRELSEPICPHWRAWPKPFKPGTDL